MDGVLVESRIAPLARAPSRRAPELTVVVPTFNERANVPLLAARLQRTLAGIDWEVIFVDDNSADGTAATARALGEGDARVRCIRRIGRRGLAGACLEGMLASQAHHVAVMDADLQHDETLLVGMLERLRGGNIDLVVASRYVGAGSAGGLAGRRVSYSRWSTALARRLLRVNLTDPMSGFFMLRRTAFEELAPSLSTQGFKILLDIVATGRGTLRIAELPYVFRERQHGESKLDARIVLDFFALLMAKLTGDAVSFRFPMFCLVGLTGVSIHMAALAVGGNRRGDRMELRAQQCAHLSRPAPHRLVVLHRPGAVRGHLRGRCRIQHGRGDLDLRLRSALVDRRARWRADERGVELCGERRLRVAGTLDQRKFRRKPVPDYRFADMNVRHTNESSAFSGESLPRTLIRGGHRFTR